MRYIIYLFTLMVWLLPTYALNVTLKKSHNVQKEFLTLSDFFDGIPDEKDQEILESPAGGASKHYAHAWVQKLAQNFDLYWAPTHYKGITLTRQQFNTVKVNPQVLIKDYISQHYVEKINEDTDVVLDSSSNYALLSSENCEPKLVNFSWVDDQRFSVTLDINGQEKKIRGGLSKVVYVPVLNKLLYPGHVIQKDDIEFKPFLAHKITAHMIQDEQALIGKTLRKRSSSKGDALFVHDVIAPIVIKRGDLVTMRVETQNVVITARGKAQCNAATGQVVQVMNLESKRLIEGVAKDSQTVVIPISSH